MAEVKLFDAIEKLRYENAQYHTANFGEQTKQTKNTETLNKTVGDLLAEFRGARAESKLDAEESRRDANKGGSKSVPDAKETEKPDTPEFELKGILQTLAGVAAGFAGFVTGLAVGFANLYGRMLKTVAKALKLDIAFAKIKDIGKVLNTKLLGVVKSVKGFIRAATLAFSINFPKITNSILGVGEKIGKLAKSFTSTAGGAVKSLTSSFANLKNAFLAGTNGVKGVARTAQGTFRSLNVIEKFFNLWGRTTGQISEGAKTIGKIMDGKVLQPFKNLISGIRGVGQSTSVLGKSLKVLFTGFKTIGRFIAFPLTIIMGIIDGFKGLMAGSDRQVGLFNKLIGGAIGAITGVLKGLVAMPLDLLKDGISWIAGKLGFENFEKMLDSFSFGELFQMVGDKIADGFVKFFEGIGYMFTNMKDQLLSPFKDGFSFGGLLTSVTKLISFIPGAFFDLIKNGISAILGIFGGDDISKALDSFSFISEYGKIIDYIATLPGKAIDAMMSMFEGFDLGAALASAGDFVTDVMNKLKVLVRSILPDPDSLLANVIPNALYEWTDTPVPPKPVKQPSTEEPVETPRMSREELQKQYDEDQAELVRVQKAYDEGNASDYDLDAAKMFAKMSKMNLEGVNQETTGIGKPEMKPEKPLTTPATAKGQELSDKSKENAQKSGGSAVAIVNAPQQSTVNNSSTTAAIIDQNLPTVDYNDRSFAFA